MEEEWIKGEAKERWREEMGGQEGRATVVGM